MALKHMDSFDDGATAYKYENGVLPTPSTSYGRLGTKGVYLGDSPNVYLQKQTNSTNDTIVVGFAMQMNLVGATDNEILLYLLESGSPQGNLRLGEDGRVKYCLSNNTTAISGATASAGALTHDSWIYLELKVKFSNTVGTVELKQNGATVFSTTGQDTLATSNAYTDDIRIGGTSSGYVHQFYLDDLYILDGAGSSPYNNFLGDIQVVPLLPSGNGNSSGMTGSDADQTDNYALVDEDPIVTTDYVESATQGHKDTYAMGNLASTSVSVYGAQVTLIAQKDDAGAKYLRPIVRTGSTDYAGTSVALGTAWVGITEIWEQNPNTSLDWTATDINGIEVGQEVRDS